MVSSIAEVAGAGRAGAGGQSVACRHSGGREHLCRSHQRPPVYPRGYVERARQTMYGGTIAHGYFTLSLVTRLSRERDGIRINLPCRMTINYGLNRVRFPGAGAGGATDSAPHHAARRGEHQPRQGAGWATAGPPADVPAGHGGRRSGAARDGCRDTDAHLLLSGGIGPHPPGPLSTWRPLHNYPDGVRGGGDAPPANLDGPAFRFPLSRE